MQDSQDDRLSAIPDEIALHIASFLEVADLGKLSVCSKRFASLLEDNTLWKLYYVRVFGQQNVEWFSSDVLSDSPTPAYRDFFKKRATIRSKLRQGKYESKELSVRNQLSDASVMCHIIGDLVAVGRWLSNKAQNLYLVDVMQDTIVRNLAGHNRDVRALSKFQPASNPYPMLVSGGYEGSVQLWNVECTERAAMLHNDKPHSSVYSIATNNELIAAGFEKRITRVWKPEYSESPIITISEQCRSGETSAVAFSSDSQHPTILFTGTSSDGIRMWDLRVTSSNEERNMQQEECVWQTTGLTSKVMALLPIGTNYCYSADLLGNLTQWDLRKRDMNISVKTSDAIWAAIADIDWSVIITSNYRGQIGIRDLASLDLLTDSEIFESADHGILGLTWLMPRGDVVLASRKTVKRLIFS